MGMRAPRPGEPAGADRIYNGATRQRVGPCRHPRSGAGAGARRHAPAAIHLRPVHDGRGIGPPRCRVLRPAPCAAGGGVGREHQHRRHQPVWPLARHRAAWLRALDAGGAGGDARGPATARRRVPIPSRAAGTSSARITSRWRRSASPPSRSASRSPTSARIPATPRRCAIRYNEKDYHQPTDEFRTDWDYTGAVEDLQLLAELGWQAATRPTMPAYHEDQQFARPRATATR